MRKVTFNRSDWSGREETMTIADDGRGSFELMDYRFRLTREEHPDSDLYELWVIRGEGWSEPLGSVTRWAGDKGYTASGTGISRDDREPYVAAAQLLCNLI